MDLDKKILLVHTIIELLMDSSSSEDDKTESEEEEIEPLIKTSIMDLEQPCTKQTTNSVAISAFPDPL